MNKVTLKINGMACGMCESHVNNVIRQEFNVKKVTSSYKKGETVILCQDVPDQEQLKNIIGQTGYVVESVNVETYEKKGLFSR